jgi:hypothetical protein
MLHPGLALEHLVPVYVQAPYFSTISSTSGDACSGLNPYIGSYVRTTNLIRGIPIVTYILQPSARASSWSSSAASPDQDSADDCPENRESICEDSAEEGRLIILVADQKHSILGRPMIE